MHENQISKIIMQKSIEIHTILGPGLFESVYEAALFNELTSFGLKVIKQKEIPAIYKNIDLGLGFRADLIVEDKVIVELKSIEQVQKVHFKQVQTYLKLTEIKLGLLINFNCTTLMEGYHRIVNSLD